MRKIWKAVSLNRSHLKLHLIIVVLALTGIAGAMVTLSGLHMVWHRMIIAIIALGLMIRFQKINLRLDYKDIFQLMGNGVIVACHWITFFESIKLSNVSIALSCLASTSLFTAFLEPVFYKRRILFYEVFFGIIIIIGLYVIFSVETEFVEGIVTALISSLFAVLFTIFNGKFISRIDPTIISLYEMLGGVVFTSAYMALSGQFNEALWQFTLADLGWLIFLGTVCTAYAFVLTVSIMKELSPFTIAISYNLEPVYSIIFALLIFGEKELMTLGFYTGALIILVTVFANGWIKHKTAIKKRF